MSTYPEITRNPDRTIEIVVPGVTRISDGAHFILKDRTEMNEPSIPILFLFVYHPDQSSDIYTLEEKHKNDPILRYGHQIWHGGRGMGHSLYYDLRTAYGMRPENGFRSK